MCIMYTSGFKAATDQDPDESKQSRRRDDARNSQQQQQKHQQHRGVSTLMYACQQGDVDYVRRILHVQPEASFHKDRTGKTAIHYCCTGTTGRSAQVADYLLMAAPDLVDSRDEDGFTPLHLAVIAGNMSLVTFLLANNADVNAVDSEKHTIVHWATVCGETEALRAVLAAGAPVSTPDVHGGYPLHYAAQMCGGEKDYELGFQVMQTLLSHPDTTVTVEDGDGRPPLLWAASAGSARAMLALIRAGSAVEVSDKDGLTALHCAASRGHTDCLDTLLTLCGSSVDVIDKNGCTALHYAVTLGHADATALLLAHGANANRQDRRGRSPAHCGCAKGQVETVKMIGSHGANLWLRNARGDLPLHEAAASGRRELVKWLLEARPSQVNARNNDGRCPIHLAALNDNSDMCKILIDKGAQINPILRTSKNVFMTPLDCAMQRGFRSTAKYLQLQGGVPSNRVGSNPPPNSGISLQIHDNVQIFNDTTDSEIENANEDKRKKRSYRRKSSYKYERRKPIEIETDGIKIESDRKLGGKHERDKTDKRKIDDTDRSPRDKLTYNSEVKILNHTENINIEQTGEVILNGKADIPKTLTKNIIKKDTKFRMKEPTIEKHPKSAKFKSKETPKQESVRRKTKQDTPDPRRKETITTTSQEYDLLEIPKVEAPKSPQSIRNVQDINENIKEINSLAQTIEAKAKSICKEVSNIENNINAHPSNADLQSLTSYEDGEHENLVVQASVHSPPKANKYLQEKDKLLKEQIEKDKLARNQAEDMYKEVIFSLKEELNSIKQEIRSIREDGQQKLESTAIEQKPSLVKQLQLETASIVGAVMKDNREEEILTETQLKLQEMEAQKIKEIEVAKIEEIVVAKIEEIKAMQIEEEQKIHDSTQIDLVDSVVESENVIVLESGNVVDTKILDNINNNEENKEVNNTKEEVETVKELVNVGLEESAVITEDLKEDIPDGVQTVINDVDSIVMEEDKNEKEDNLEKEDKIETEDKIENEEHAIIDDADKTSLQEDAEFFGEKVTAILDPETQMVGNLNNADAVTNEVGEMNDPTLQLNDLKTSEEKTENEKTKTGEAEKVSAEFQAIKKDVEDFKKKTKERIKSDKGYEKSEKHKKREHHLRLPRDDATSPLRVESSIEARSSEEEHSSESSESTVSTITNREHESFTVLEENEQKARLKDRKSSRKLRSRSEETRLNKQNIDTSDSERRRFHKSRIPTSLSKSDRHLDQSDNRRAHSNLESSIPILPNLGNKYRTKSDTNLANIRAGYSDHSDDDDIANSLARRKRTKRKSSRALRSAGNVGSDYESSNLIDSGFEPSPRSSRIPKWKNVSDRGVNMSSVTQSIQTNIRRYHLERKVFQHLLDLKRLQIRAGQHNESILVKRAIDAYHRSCAATVGAGRYKANDFTFKSFEQFLYDSLRKIQKNADPEYLKGLPESARENPMFCTQSTHRCMHATHAYTGIPCAAYLPKMDHHSIPKIGFTSCKPQGFLPQIKDKKAVTLELCHGNDKQVISLPTDRLDQNKRYYVTFTVKGQPDGSPPNKEDVSNKEISHKHSKSV